ncbi:uncharacterized protein LOC142786443 isoform X3 [Rhipicephalus microplus]|uniref:uncharacterized protein LOC142786443 isoform X3 n=1 Tax=Rhipicephalus microplus TaxID=6941 RepID=UPI003F6C1248
MTTHEANMEHIYNIWHVGKSNDRSVEYAANMYAKRTVLSVLPPCDTYGVIGKKTTYVEMNQLAQQATVLKKTEVVSTHWPGLATGAHPNKASTFVARKSLEFSSQKHLNV